MLPEIKREIDLALLGTVDNDENFIGFSVRAFVYKNRADSPQINPNTGAISDPNEIAVLDVPLPNPTTGEFIDVGLPTQIIISCDFQDQSFLKQMAKVYNIQNN